MLARPDEEVAARVRVGLTTPGGGCGGAGGSQHRAEAATGRARRDRRRSLALGLAGLTVVGALALVPRAGPAPADGAPAVAGALSPTDPLGPGSLLDLDQVSTLVPGVSGRAPAADVTSVTGVGDPRPVYRGGWCGDAVLLGAPPPEQVWAAEWTQEGLVGTTATRGPAGGVREVVLRWPDAAGARAWADATHASPTRCRDPRGAPFPPTAFRPWAMSTSEGTMTSVAIVPVGAPVVTTDLSEPTAPPVWRVRAVHARGTTVVDLTTVVRAPGAGEAVRSTTVLLEAAAARAEQGERGEPG